MVTKHVPLLGESGYFGIRLDMGLIVFAFFGVAETGEGIFRFCAGGAPVAYYIYHTGLLGKIGQASGPCFWRL